MRRSHCSTAGLAVVLVLVLTACGGSTSTHTASTGRSPAAAVTPATSGCSASLSAATPTGPAAVTPSLATLIQRSRGRHVVSFSASTQVCAGSGSSPTMTRVSLLARLRPTVLAEITETVAGQPVRLRIIGPTAYVDLPQLAARDRGRPWLSISLARVGAALGINLNQLLAESANVDPSHNLRLIASANRFHSIGQTTLDGQPVYGFQGTFDVARESSTVLSPGLAKQLKAKLLAIGAAQEVVTSYVTAAGAPVRVVTSLPATNRGPIETVEDVIAINIPVRVSPPPASQTIGYEKARSLVK